MKILLSLGPLLPFLFFVLSPIIAQSTEQAAKRSSTGLTDTVTWDPTSISLLSKPTFLLSAEFHPWRLPNPNLWPDVLQKIKANGFNAVSFYVNWAVHYPTPGTNGGNGDFEEGTYRDIQGFIDAAKREGLWLIARPGPYVNGETTGGGFPGWVGNIAGSLRSNNPNYTQAWTPYMTAITKIIAKNQISNGGPVVLIQAENEFSASASGSPYMQAIIDLYRANGIVIPITHNDQHGGRDGNFSPDKPGPGQVDIYCADSYPQGANSWAQVQAVYHSNFVANAPSSPMCLAEFGGGFLLGWGSGTRGGTGYEKYSNEATGLTNADYENVFYKDAYSQGAALLNIYMLFGGTNWGHTYEPTVYTSYDYGGGINENRVANRKMNEMRVQGLFLRVSQDFPASQLLNNGTNYTTNAATHTAERRNVRTGAGFYILRQNASTSTAVVTTKLIADTSAGRLTIPVNGSITFNGRESKILPVDYVFGKAGVRMVYSTIEAMTWSTIDTTEHIILYAPTAQTGEVVLAFATAPSVDLSSAPSAASFFITSTKQLRLNFATTSTQQSIAITQGSLAVIVHVMDRETAYKWSAPLIPGSGEFSAYWGAGTNQSVLVGGPYLVRNASISGNTLALTGDINGTTPIEIIAPQAVTRITWNGQTVQTTFVPARRSLTGTLSGVASAVSLPALTSWKVSGSLPEIDPAFDDSTWINANLRTTNYTNLPPLSGDFVLYSQQYGIYGGHLIWRGHFTASGQEKAITLTVQGGLVFGYSVWFNGVLLGSRVGSTTDSVTTDTWDLTTTGARLRVGGDNVVVVLQDHMGIVETSTSSGKEPRGIRGYAINGGSTKFTSWRLQGNLGGAAEAPDTFRGYLNEGGLFAERTGAHLPGYPDSNWRSTTNLSVTGAGVNFFRTTFDLNIDPNTDVPIRLSFTPSATTSNYRAQIYINGWQFGEYINNIGPQTVYVLPAGILRTRSTNTLAIALWSLDADGASIPGITLIQDGVFTSALHIQDYTSAPDYVASQRPSPTALPPM